MNIYQKLIKVKQSVEFLKKEAKGYQFQYNPSSQVISSVREKMNEVGLFLESRIDKPVLHLKNDLGGKEYLTELHMTMTWINAEKPEERIEIPWYGQGLDTGEKGVGKALTYAEKFFILKQFNIPTDKDDPDAHQKEQEQTKASEKTLNLINKLLADKAKATGKHTKEQLYEVLKERIKVSKEMENWTQTEASKAIKFLQGASA